MTHDPPPNVPEEPLMVSDSEGQDNDSRDDAFNYHCSLMNMALVLRNFNDATEEGDGPRIIRRIKVFLLPHIQDGSSHGALDWENSTQAFFAAWMSRGVHARGKGGETVTLVHAVVFCRVDVARYTE